MDDAPQRDFPLMTWALCALNVAAFAWLFVRSGAFLLVPADVLIEHGGLSALALWQGDVWRLVSALFLHGGVWHVGLNLWVLFIVGEVLERNIGGPRTLLIYLVSGIVGGAASVLWRPALTVGASGAILGLVGALFALAYGAREQPFSKAIVASLRPFVIGTLVIGFLLPFVDNAAHIGGFMAGFVLGFALLNTTTQSGADMDVPPHRYSTLALVVALGATFVIVSFALRPTFSPRFAAAMSFDASGRGNIDDAKRYLAPLTDSPDDATDDVAVLMALARLAAVEGDADTARRYLKTVLDAFDDDAQAARMQRAFVETAHLSDPYDSAPKLTLLFCDVMLDAPGPPDAELMNNCAWTMVRDEPPLGDVDAALKLAERAVDLTLNKTPGELTARRRSEGAAFLHTWATAFARAGKYPQAIAAIERIEAQGLGMRPIFESDRSDFVRALARKHKAETEAKTPLAPPDELPPLPRNISDESPTADSATPTDGGPADQSAASSDAAPRSPDGGPQ